MMLILRMEIISNLMGICIQLRKAGYKSFYNNFRRNNLEYLF